LSAENISTLVIDDLDVASDAEALRELGIRLVSSLRRTGFVALDVPGISAALTTPTYDAMRRFFALPISEKMTCSGADIHGQRGYTALGIERAKDQRLGDLKEFMHVGPEQQTAVGLENRWPEDVKFRSAHLRLYAALLKLGEIVCRAVALGLGLPQDMLWSNCRRGNHLLRSLHYPPLGSGAKLGAVRAAAHEDINVVTLLVASRGSGLQVLGRSSGEGGTEAWIDAPMRDGVILCNVGDMLQRLTNNWLPSTTHRVVNPVGKDGVCSRYSLPLFVHFDSDFMISTLASCISADSPNMYPDSILAGDYLRERLEAIGLG